MERKLESKATHSETMPVQERPQAGIKHPTHEEPRRHSIKVNPTGKKRGPLSTPACVNGPVLPLQTQIIEKATHHLQVNLRTGDVAPTQEA